MRPELHCVIVAEHVVAERDHAGLGEVDAAARDGAIRFVGHAALAPVAVRVEDAGERAVAAAQRAVEVAREDHAGERLEVDFFNRVSVARDAAKDRGVERRLLGERPQAAAHEDLLADLLRARLPFGFRPDDGKWARGVEIADDVRPLVFRGKRRRGGAEGNKRAGSDNERKQTADRAIHASSGRITAEAGKLSKNLEPAGA